MSTYHRYRVSGRGPFPFDMLRYDQAWPENTLDAHRMAAMDRRTLLMQSDRRPTVERWASFGWTVELHDATLGLSS